MDTVTAASCDYSLFDRLLKRHPIPESRKHLQLVSTLFNKELLVEQELFEHLLRVVGAILDCDRSCCGNEQLEGGQPLLAINNGPGVDHSCRHERLLKDNCTEKMRNVVVSWRVVDLAFGYVLHILP